MKNVLELFEQMGAELVSLKAKVMETANAPIHKDANLLDLLDILGTEPFYFHDGFQFCELLCEAFQWKIDISVKDRSTRHEVGKGERYKFEWVLDPETWILEIIWPPARNLSPGRVPMQDTCNACTLFVNSLLKDQPESFANYVFRLQNEVLYTEMESHGFMGEAQILRARLSEPSPHSGDPSGFGTPS